MPEADALAAGEEDRSSLPAGLGVAAVARRLGVAPATLRTWDRRYGVGPTAHVSGSHRRYTAADVSRLQLMRRLMLEGVTPAEAAQSARGAHPAESGGTDPLPLDILLDRPGRRSRAGGGRVLPLGEAGPATRGLARAAMALDSAACAGVLTASLGTRGVVDTWEDVVLPVLHGVGLRWQSTGAGVEVEHVLSECVEDALRAVARRVSRPRNVRPVLLAALEPEEHRLPLHAVAAALAERSVGVRMLGARVPAPALSAAVGRTGAAVVFLWSAGGRARPRTSALTAFPAIRPAPVLLLGGPGWLGHPRLPAGAQVLKDLSTTVDAVTGALGLDRPASP